MLSILLLVVFTALFVEAQVRSPNFQYNVTSPAPNSPYVASQILPLIYDVASNATSESMLLE
jgi:hypothetical protein